ncbi:MAG: hypothetical protein E4G94_08870 [ANME-2 cluster archaeon]|nr:MAG: hypothetical protein E4G94_08870 [ANME-2 cluster archaeon]
MKYTLMLYFNKFIENIVAEIKQIKNDPRSFICGLFLYFLLSIFVGSMFILLFVNSLYTLINPFVFIIFSVIVLLSLFLLRKKAKLNFSEKNIILLIVIVWILVQFLVVISIELEYGNIKDYYSQEYLSLTRQGTDEVNATWSIVDSFDEEYNGVYGVKGSRIPSRQISSNIGSMILSFNPILRFYFFNFEGMPVDGFFKLIFVQNTGNCGEFASSMKLLMKDVTGFDTRIVHMEGKDHAFPEININNDWWVFDKIYTTPSQPIKSSDYASFLSAEDQNLFNCISDLKDYTNEVSVLSEHGFNSSNLTITAIQDITVNESDNEPMNNAVVEIFAYVNSYDPRVNIGKTDENGQYSTILRSDKEYLILVKNEKLKAIGFKDLLIPLDESSSITVYLHKYE